MTMPSDPHRPPDEPVDDQDRPHDQPPDEPRDDQDRSFDGQDRPFDGQPTGAVTSVTSVTAAPDPAPAEADGPGENGREVEVETTRAAAAHTVAYPGPIPDYAMETAVERPAAAPVSDADDPAPTRRYPGDAGLTVPLTVPLAREPQYPLPPDPPDRGPELPQLAPVPPSLAPEPPSLAPEPPYPVAPVPASRAAHAPASAPTTTGPPGAGAAGPAYPEASVRPRRRPLFGTIVWGVILLTLAGYVLLGVLVPAPADPTLWLLGGVIVIGLLLIVIGIIAALRRAG